MGLYYIDRIPVERVELVKYIYFQWDMTNALLNRPVKQASKGDQMSGKETIRLTKRSVEAIEVTTKEFQVMDADLKGFGVRVKPSGVKSYFIRYRNENHRPRRLVLGQHGQITADQARTQAKQHFAIIATGADPSKDRTDARKAETVNDLLNRYLDEHVRVHNKPKTQKEVARLIEAKIRPAIGRMTVNGIERKDISRLHNSLKDTPTQANRIRALLSKTFNLAEEMGIAPIRHKPLSTHQAIQ